MGVPAFYRWLAEKYPLVVVDVVEEEPIVIGDVSIPVDTTKPNPNGVEFDNLYLDMNGIIHPCFHPEDRPSPMTFDEVFQCMFDYIDRLFGMVRPRKVLYMAIDGVAPRAKMNQQRSRRFRAAKDAGDAAAEEEKLREQFESEGRKLPPKLQSQTFDSNVITPGTPFMAVLSIALQYYIHLRLNNDPGWKDVKQIVKERQKRKAGDQLDDDQKSTGAEVVAKKPYQFLNIWTLREYLDYEMRSIPNPPFEIDLERIVDDLYSFVLYPHMPTLEIREGAINLLMAVYKKEFKALGGYLTDASKLNLSRVEHFIQAVGCFEDKVFQKRAQLHQRQAQRIKHAKVQGPQVQPDCIVAINRFQGCRLASGPAPAPYQQYSRSSGRGNPQKVARLSSEASSVAAAIVEAENSSTLDIKVHENKEDLKAKLKEILREKSDAFNSKNPQEADKVKLGEPGWRDRYYEEKFSAKTHEEREAVRKDVILRYTDGLCWVMHYYYEGVCSWQWFYPYHYAPFASDLKDLGQLNISFDLGTPFKPFNQLLGVFPAASAHALPEQYRKLMTDPNSPIIDFYPTDFEVDMNGKRYAWQGIAKLPFIDQVRLLSEVEKIEHTLTEEETCRNSMMFEMLFVSSSHPLSVCIYLLDDRCRQLTDKDRVEVKEQIDPKYSQGMNGYLSSCAGESCPPVFQSPVEFMDDIMDNQVICAIYRLPDEHKHISRPPASVIFPKKTVMVGDLKPAPVLWHEDSGRNPPGTISQRQLGDAAHRLIVNSLQVNVDSNGYGNQMHALRQLSPAEPQYYPPHTSNNDHGLLRFPPPRTLVHPQAQQYRNSSFTSEQRSSSAAYHSQNRSNLQHQERRHAYYQSGSHQNGGLVYPQRPITQAPPRVRPDPFQGVYNNNLSYQPSGEPRYLQRFCWVPD
ncbi:hypothetical protein M0R45_013325 [Rubus argutus]|uniref:5'-3' exoribonuclease n=1 Tax=Rubus argutus TaxID=59490 RepID=A0AAW1XI32_RUBAR